MSGEALHEVVWHALAMKTTGSTITITSAKNDLDVRVNGKYQSLLNINNLRIPGIYFSTHSVFMLCR